MAPYDVEVPVRAMSCPSGRPQGNPPIRPARPARHQPRADEAAHTRCLTASLPGDRAVGGVGRQSSCANAGSAGGSETIFELPSLTLVTQMFHSIARRSRRWSTRPRTNQGVRAPSRCRDLAQPTDVAAVRVHQVRPIPASASPAPNAMVDPSGDQTGPRASMSASPTCDGTRGPVRGGDEDARGAEVPLHSRRRRCRPRRAGPWSSRSRRDCRRPATNPPESNP